jgi:hypothetical protein
MRQQFQDFFFFNFFNPINVSEAHQRDFALRKDLSQEVVECSRRKQWW